MLNVTFIKQITDSVAWRQTKHKILKKDIFIFAVSFMKLLAVVYLRFWIICGFVYTKAVEENGVAFYVSTQYIIMSVIYKSIIPIKRNVD